MNNVLRILNFIAIAVLLAFGAQSSPPESQDAAYTFGFFLGMGLCILAPTLALFALREAATPRLRRIAVRASAIQIVAFAGLGILPRLDNPLLIPMVIGVLFFCLPFALNIWRLRAMNREQLDGGGGADSASWSPGQHWRGDLPLGVAFWISSAFLGIFLFFCFGTFGTFVDQLPLRSATRGTVLMFVIVLVCATWLGVGIWRAATRRAADGTRAWPVMAKATVMLSTLVFAFVVARFTWPQLKENALIAIGFDPLSAINARVTTNDTVLLLHGTFGEGSAEKVRHLLAKTPTIKTIALSSNGGRLREASEIADMTRSRRLNTYVDTRCESACTYVFLAGQDRAATPNARIGFHRPSFAGVNALAQFNATQNMLDTYRDAGIPSEFLERVRATDPSSMWYPTREELVDAKVINRVSLGGETAAISVLALGSKQEMAAAFRKLPMMASIERHFPGTLDKAVQAAWNEHTQGGIDADVGTAARNVISDLYPKILAAADDVSLDIFAGVMLDEMKAASAISTQACEQLLQGRLNIAQVLSPELAQREMDWAVGVLKTERLQARARVNPQDFQAAAVSAMASMTPEMVDVVGHPENYPTQPKLRCEATIAFYDSIIKMPADQRHLLLRGMFEPDV